MEGHENCTCDPATHHHAQDSNGLVKLTLLEDLRIYHWLFVLIIQSQHLSNRETGTASSTSIRVQQCTSIRSSLNFVAPLT